ncbi:hypothetical protein [Mucilaginibacter sp.]|uniref:hypothetical protein n=1 Tax=Mucilaginibacter sp. TaxID=1882438 RepID=UPI002ED3B1E7
MKHQNNTLLILSGLLIITTCSFVYVVFARPRTGSPKLIYDKNQSDGSSLSGAGNVFYQAYIPLLLPVDGMTLKDTVMLQDTTLKKRSLASVVNGRSRLVFRYSSKDCSVCVDSVLKNLEKKFKSKTEKVIIISDNFNDRDFIIKTDYEKPVFAKFDLLDDINGLNMAPIENKNLPFLFVLTPGLQVQKVFLPFKEDLKKLKEYLNYIDKDIH